MGELLNKDILAMYIGDSFGDHLDMFGAKKRMNYGDIYFGEYLFPKRGPKKFSPPTLPPNAPPPNFVYLLIRIVLSP